MDSRFNITRVDLASYYTKSDSTWNATGSIYTLDKICWIVADLRTTGSGYASGGRLNAGNINYKYCPRTSITTTVAAQENIGSNMTAWLDLYFSVGSFIFDNRSGKTIK